MSTAATPSERNVRWYWEDFTVGRVREFGATPVTREATTAFAAQFDPQPFHLDDAAAEASLFGQLSASGWHTCAMAMRMMCDDYLLESSSLGSPGIDHLRWLKPVFPGDVLSVRLTTVDKRPMASRPAVGLVSSKWEVLNQHREVVLTMQGWGMFGRRDAVTTAATAGDGAGAEPEAKSEPDPDPDLGPKATSSRLKSDANAEPAPRPPPGPAAPGSGSLVDPPAAAS